MDGITVGRLFREESGRAVGSLVRAFGDIDLAEDAVQDAFAAAMKTWPRDGLPPNPGAWITRTARNRAVDRLRRDARGRELVQRAAVLDTVADGPGAEDLHPGPVDDDRLRLIFTCCHPALSSEARIALTLRLVGGLSTAEVASAFLVPEPTMAKRLVRAKHKIAAARIPFRLPAGADLAERLGAVLAVLYLVYNAGSGRPGRSDLRAEGIRLTRLVRALLPDEPEVGGLLALLLVTESRQLARFDDERAIVRLADQDRSRWDRPLVDEAAGILRTCAARGRPGTYQLQAAIGLVHAAATSTASTDWDRIVGLYDQLLALAPTPVVALNRAIAIGEVDGPGAALALVDGLDLDGYHLVHAARADLLVRLGRRAEATAAYRRARALAPTEAERTFLEARMAAIRRER